MPESKTRAQCVSSARWDPYGGGPEPEAEGRPYRGTRRGYIGAVPSPAPRLWTQSAWLALANTIVRMATDGGNTSLDLQTEWSGNIRWARNRISTAGDRRDNTLTLTHDQHGAAQAITLNQLDASALDAAMAWVEQAITLYRTEPLEVHPPPPFHMEDYLHPTLWFDATYDVDGAQRAAAVNGAISPIERAGMLSAGYLEVSAAGVAIYRPWQEMNLYYPVTEVQYSVTVRDPQGTGSGWAGVNWNDWRRLDVAAVSAVALEKCLTSRNPVAIEPGRYTAILEPQAVFDFARMLIDDIEFDWEQAANPDRRNKNKYHDPAAPDRTKIGQRVLDERLTVRSDPMDGDVGFVPFNGNGEPYRPAIWFEDGVLTHLPYDRTFAVNQHLGNLGMLNSHAFRVDGRGALSSRDEMIATTKRGLLVTRFSNIQIIDQMSLLSSGYTRDGLWLIENGKISKPVKNFRFTESPLFVLNNVEQIGVSTRVFSPRSAAMAPTMKIRDFSFMSLADAV